MNTPIKPFTETVSVTDQITMLIPIKQLSDSVSVTAGFTTLSTADDPYILPFVGASEKGTQWWAGMNVVNPDSTTITVTQVKMCWEDNDIVMATPLSDQQKPTSGWTVTGTPTCLQWDGSVTVPPNDSYDFRAADVGAEKPEVPSDITFDAVVTEKANPSARSRGTQVHSDMDSVLNVYWEEFADDTTETYRANTDIGFHKINGTSATDGLVPGTEYAFTLQYEESDGTASVPDASTWFNVTIPNSWTGVTLVTDDFSPDAIVSGGGSKDWVIYKNQPPAISNRADHITFRATSPTSVPIQTVYRFNATVFNIQSDGGHFQDIQADIPVIIQGLFIKPFTDTVAVTDQIIFKVTKALTDSVPVTDQITNIQVTKTLSDAVAVTDQIAMNTPIKSFTETVSVTDQITTKVTKSLTATVSIMGLVTLVVIWSVTETESESCFIGINIVI